MVEEDAAKAGHDGLNIEGQVCNDSEVIGPGKMMRGARHCGGSKRARSYPDFPTMPELTLSIAICRADMHPHPSATCKTTQRHSLNRPPWPSRWWPRLIVIPAKFDPAMK